MNILITQNFVPIPIDAMVSRGYMFVNGINIPGQRLGIPERLLVVEILN